MGYNIKSSYIKCNEILNVDAAVKKDMATYIKETEENKEDIRKVEMDSYRNA